ncbi:MAG: 3'-5' exoribonuclease YhaM family protein, partial [Calditrichia bacterium]
MQKSENKVGLKTTPIGKQYVGFCVTRKKEIRYKSTGEPYLALDLGDWSGRLSAKIWSEAQKFDRLFKVGDVVKVKAMIQTYQNRRELQILKIRKAVEEDHVPPEQLLPSSKKDVPGLRQKFREHLNGLTNEHLKKLMARIFEDEKFTEQYLQTPAGKLWHHNYLYGMLEHIVAMLDTCDVLKLHYPRLDVDLLKCGVVLHDVGKMREYGIRGFIDFTDEGRLIGHIALGYEFVYKKIDEIENFPAELRNQLLHLILSHQGEKEKGSPVVPMTLEAIVLYFLDELDSKANAFTRIIESDRQAESNWSKYVNLMDRFVYIGSEPDEEATN